MRIEYQREHYSMLRKPTMMGKFVCIINLGGGGICLYNFDC